MFSRKNRNNSIGGDYQLNAVLHGPVSQRLWHMAKQDIMREYLLGGSFRHICDAGCGSGVVANAVAAFLPESEIVGFDVFDESIRFAKEQYGRTQNLRFEQQDLLLVPEGSTGRFDFIYSMEVIEHFKAERVKDYLRTLHCLGNDNARYLLTTPDYRSLWPFIEWGLDVFHLAPKLAGHQHLTKFTRRKLARLLEEEGFRVLGMQNFCGLSPFVGHLSVALARFVEKIERKLHVGNIILCEFEKQ